MVIAADHAIYSSTAQNSRTVSATITYTVFDSCYTYKGTLYIDNANLILFTHCTCFSNCHADNNGAILFDLHTFPSNEGYNNTIDFCSIIVCHSQSNFYMRDQNNLATDKGETNQVKRIIHNMNLTYCKCQGDEGVIKLSGNKNNIQFCNIDNCYSKYQVLYFYDYKHKKGYDSGFVKYTNFVYNSNSNNFYGIVYTLSCGRIDRLLKSRG